MSDTCACGRAAVLTRPFGSTMYLPLCRQCAGGLWYEPDPTAPKEATDALPAYRAHSGNHGLPAGHGAGMEDAARYRLWHWKYWCQDPRQAYRRLWNSINLTPKPRYGRVPVAYDHPSEGLNPTKKGITHYEAFPWSEEDFDAAYPASRAPGTWKGRPLTVHPNPWVFAIGFAREEAQDAN